MYKNIIKNYIQKLTKKDITNYINKNNYKVTPKEIDIIYNHIKTYQNNILDNQLYYIQKLKGQINDNNYYLILELYNKYKNTIE